MSPFNHPSGHFLGPLVSGYSIVYQSVKVFNVINTFYSLVTFQNTYKMASQLNNLAWTTYKKNPNLYIWLPLSFSFHFHSCFLCFFILPLLLVFLYLSLSSLVSFLFFFIFLSVYFQFYGRSGRSTFFLCNV